MITLSLKPQLSDLPAAAQPKLALPCAAWGEGQVVADNAVAVPEPAPAATALRPAFPLMPSCTYTKVLALKYTAFVRTVLNLMLAGTACLMRPLVTLAAHWLMGAADVTFLTALTKQ